MIDGHHGTSAGGWRRGIRKPGPPGRSIVVKFGGSLLARDDWPDLLRSLVAACRHESVAVVVGGGSIVDSIRRIDSAAGFDAAVSHRLAIDAMGITARRVAASLGWPLSGNMPATAPACAISPGMMSPCVIDIPTWLAVGGRLAKLPAGWHVTSDSIAALVAAESGSDLLLAKSVPPPGRSTGGRPPHEASARWVDDYFATASANVPRIEWAAPVSPTTSRRQDGRQEPRAAASRRRGSRPPSRRSPTAE